MRIADGTRMREPRKGRGKRKAGERERERRAARTGEPEEGVRWGSEPSRGEELSEEQAFFT